MRTSTWNESDFKPESAFTAVALSMVPGLGQIYNGEARKGVLFFLVGAANFVFLSLICLKGILVTGAKFIGANMHVRLNAAVMDCLNNLDMRSPQMLMLCVLLAAFTMFCVKDALESRIRLRRKEIYSPQFMQISEAASGSYIAHALMFSAMFLLVLFLFVPPDAKKQITEIEFIPPQTPSVKPSDSQLRSATNSQDAGRVKPHQLKDTPRSQSAQPSKRSAESPKSTEQAEPTKAKPQQTKPEPKSEPKAEEPKAQTPKAEPKKSEPKKQPEPNKSDSSHENSPVKTPKPPALPMPPTNAPRTPMMAPPPMPAQAVTKPVQSATPTPSREPSRTSSSTTSGVNNPQPLIASAALPPSPFGSTPAPTATSNSGKSSNVAAPAPASLHHSAGVGGPAAPEVQRDAGEHSGNSAPQPVPSGDGPSKRNSSSGPGGAPPTPHAASGGPAGHGLNSGMPIPVGAPAPRGSGTSPSKDKNDDPPNGGSRALPDYGAYMADLQRRIKRAWIPPRSPESKRVVVIFKIFKNGEMSNLRLLKSSGDAQQDEHALKAIENAAPFKPLPVNSEDDIDVQFTFDYNLFIGKGGGVKF